MVKEYRKLSGLAFNANRGAFWSYCQSAAAGAKARAKKSGVAYSIDSRYIETLLVDNEWRCAVSGHPLSYGVANMKFLVDPFGPSLDRIVPELGYVPGNVRVVCNIANAAMNEWGLENLLIFLEHMRQHLDKDALRAAVADVTPVVVKKPVRYQKKGPRFRYRRKNTKNELGFTTS